MKDHITYQAKDTFNNLDTLRANNQLIPHQFYWATGQSRPYVALATNVLSPFSLDLSTFTVINGPFALTGNKLIIATANNSFLRPDIPNNYNIELPLNSSFSHPIGYVAYVERRGTGVPTIAGAPGVTVINATDIEDQHDVVALVKVDTNTWVVWYLHKNGAGGGGGEANTASNVGGAVGLFLEKVGVDLRFRTIEAGDNITFDLSDPNKVVINGSAGGGGGGIDAITTESAGANTTITTTNSALHALTMTANLTATISDFNEAAKTHRFVLKVIQDATGGRTLTIAGNVLFPAGIQPSNSESAGAVDLYEFVWDGTNWLLDNYTAAQA